MRALALLLLPALGCANAIVSIEKFRSHDAYTDEAHARFEAELAQGPLTKADVLASLGPPNHVIGQPEGDVFVYRRVARDAWTLNVNPGTVSFLGPAPPIPLYFSSRTLGRDDTLMVFFDEEGRMRTHGERLGIGAENTWGGP